MQTEATLQALNILRDPGQFQWYVIPIFVIVVYIYSVEVQRRDWSTVMAGLAFYGMDLFNELQDLFRYKRSRISGP